MGFVVWGCLLIGWVLIYKRILPCMDGFYTAVGGEVFAITAPLYLVAVEVLFVFDCPVQVGLFVLQLGGEGEEVDGENIGCVGCVAPEIIKVT